MASKRPVHVSQRIIAPLSALMIIYATVAFTGVPKILWGEGSPLFTTTRHPETGDHFLNFRRKTAPVLIYHGLHAAPAIIWSTLMPLQHIDSFRNKYPDFHRSSGYIILTGSLILSLSGYWFLLSNNAHSHPDRYHLHDLNGWSPIPWPTFEMALWVLATPYYITLYKTATTARARDFVSHRRWAVLHTMFASIITFERVALTLSYAFGWALALFPKEQVHEFFNVAQDLASMAAAELDMFAFVDVIAFGMMIAWMVYEFGRAGYFGGLTEYLSSSAEKETASKKVE
ncbi:fungal transcriptional regulatory protein [Pochonia chlamydosporia 170]|uniref:Fungal transcriptional regulatory protein n=1 Tax=Pochonia chlamydosporia 170 TaxID=1380566 RepID=A0A179FME8_METCM|nr:fungal transcriptional regulatory protein [Pochonia chlamydosporia 170]OAQ66341.1 fungal transcriptional regulatory protein [Pochonia chlamydosporia 170]